MRWLFETEGPEGKQELLVELIQQNESSFRFKVGEEIVELRDPRAFPSSLECQSSDGRLLLAAVEYWNQDQWRLATHEGTWVLKPRDFGSRGQKSMNQVRSQMPGKVLKILAKEGQNFKAGDTLLIIEAMKMENEIRAEAPGMIKKIPITEGVSVEAGALLLELGPANEVA